MTERKPAVVMTTSGRVKEYANGADEREILNDIYHNHQTAGSGWDRPERLFVGGECVVASGLTDMAWEYGKFQRAKEEELDAALDDWIERRFRRKPTEDVE
jgi:hypothetical protein